MTPCERIVIRPVRRADMIARAEAKGLSGAVVPRASFKGWAAERGGRLVGIGVVMALGDRVWGFCDVDACMKSRPATLHRLAIMGVAIADAMGMPMHVTRTAEENGSERWLRRLGFRPTDETANGREVWVNR